MLFFGTTVVGEDNAFNIKYYFRKMNSEINIYKSSNFD